MVGKEVVVVVYLWWDGFGLLLLILIQNIYTHPYTYTVKQTSAEYNKIQNSLVCYFCCCCFLGAASCSCFLEYCYNSMHHTNTITNKFTHSHPFLGKYTHEWRQQRRRRWQTKTKRGRKFVKIFLGFSRPKITY